MKKFQLLIILIPLYIFFGCDIKDVVQTEVDNEIIDVVQTEVDNGINDDIKPEEDSEINDEVQTEEDIEKAKEVKEYIYKLKTNQYEDRDFPEFTIEQIGELLKYRNEKDTITKYPKNPLSSLYQHNCELGVYVLWTIEVIRMKSVNSNLLIAGRYPSMNPILRMRVSDGFTPFYVFEVEAYKIASDAYYTWWTSNKDKSLIKIMEIDPLENTIYKWY